MQRHEWPLNVVAELYVFGSYARWTTDANSCQYRPARPRMAGSLADFSHGR